MTDRVVAQLNTALMDRYEVIREIGAGGMATVFLARDVRHQRNVALKLLNPELGAVLGADRFLAEIQVTANLQHPNLLPLFDSGEADGLLFYVMPFVDGETLRGKLEREKQLPVDEAVRLAIAVSGALAYAHRHGVIHRDLKPENILLHEGQPLVADFGIALAVSKAGGARITQTGLSLGTPQYMSPEQATGDRAIDGRTDIYSLAAVLYEMLTGDPPHTASTSQGVIAKVLTDRPRGVRATRAAVPEHVEAAIERALEKLPADRWGTVGEFADALSGRVIAVSATQAARATRSRRRDPVVLGLAGIAIAAIGVAGAAWKQARNREEPPVVRFTLIAPADAVPIGGLMPSPDGRLIVYAAMTPHGRQLYARPIDQTVARPIAGTEGATTTVMFSPDGKWIAFGAGGKLKKVLVAGGAPIVLADVVYDTGIDWSPGDVIVVGMQPAAHCLRRVPAGGGQFVTLAKPDPAIGANLCFNPIVLPDGKTVLFGFNSGAAADHETTLALTTFDGGKIEPLGIRALAPLGVFEDRLFYLTMKGTVMAVPFDRRHHPDSANAVPVLDGVSACDVCMGLAMGRNGTIVYSQGAVQPRLSWIAERDTAVDVAQASRSYLEPRLSPDGRSIAVQSPWGSSAKTDISIIDVSTGTPRRLTSDGNNSEAEWTPDGKRVIYVSDRGGKTSVWWQSADGTTPAERLTESSRPYLNAIVSPNGRTILVGSVDGGVNVIDTMSLSGDRTPHPFLHLAPFSASTPRFSPDGRWFLHNSNQAGQPDVYVRSFSNPGTVIPISSNGGEDGVWSRDGRHVFYRRADGKIVDVSVTTTPTFAVLSSRVLYDDKFGAGDRTAGYDVSRDGKRLLVVRSAVEHQEITVVTNWLSEARRRIGKQ